MWHRRAGIFLIGVTGMRPRELKAHYRLYSKAILVPLLKERTFICVDKLNFVNIGFIGTDGDFL